MSEMPVQDNRKYVAQGHRLRDESDHQGTERYQG